MGISISNRNKMIKELKEFCGEILKVHRKEVMLLPIKSFLKLVENMTGIKINRDRYSRMENQNVLSDKLTYKTVPKLEELQAFSIVTRKPMDYFMVKKGGDINSK